MDGKQTMERRTFLNGLTAAASLGILLEGSHTAPVPGQNSMKTGAGMAGQDSFESSQVAVSGNTIFVRHYGKGPGIFYSARFPTHKLDVAICRPETCRRPHRDLRRPARLRTQWNTRFHRRSLPLFKAHDGKGISQSDGTSLAFQLLP